MRLLSTAEKRSHSFASESNDEFTANDNSTGNSGGITDVSIRTHSKNNLYLLRLGSSDPGKGKEKKRKEKNQRELVRTAFVNFERKTVVVTFNPYVRTGGDSENQQK